MTGSSTRLLAGLTAYVLLCRVYSRVLLYYGLLDDSFPRRLSSTVMSSWLGSVIEIGRNSLFGTGVSAVCSHTTQSTAFATIRQADTRVDAWLTTINSFVAARVTIVLVVSVFYTAIFPYHYDMAGEIGSLYVPFIDAANIPGATSNTSPFIQATAYFTLAYYLSTVFQVDTILTIKILRTVLGVMAALVVYELSTLYGLNTKQSLLTALLFGLSLYQYHGIAGDQFKNLVGVFFSVCLLSYVVARQRGVIDRSIPLFTVLITATLLSHRVYLFLIPVVTTVYLLSRLCCRRLSVGFLSTATVLSISGIFAAGVFTDTLLYGISIGGTAIYIPQIAGLFLQSQDTFGNWNILNEVLSIGALFYNLWLTWAILGVVLTLRKHRRDPSFQLVATCFIVLAALSKDYLLGFPLTPGRFRMLLAPMLTLFSVLAFVDVETLLNARTSGPPTEFAVFGAGTLIGVNLVIYEFSTLRPVFSGFLLASDKLAYVFGGIPNSNVLLLPVLLALLVVFTAFVPVGHISRNSLLISRVGLTRLATVLAAVLLFGLAADRLDTYPLQLVGVSYMIVAGSVLWSQWWPKHLSALGISGGIGVITLCFFFFVPPHPAVISGAGAALWLISGIHLYLLLR